MKVSIGSRIVDGPWGGGNLFVENMTNFLIKNGHKVIYDLSEPDIDLILLTDPRSRKESSSTFNHLEISKYKKYVKNNVVVVQRINECDERKGTDAINQFYLEASNSADHIIFVSSWLRDIYLNLGMVKEKTSVILAGANSEIFNADGSDAWNKKEKLKLLTHHWSNHKNKGFKIYKKLDDLLVTSQWKKKIEFTYIGNVNEEYKFQNTRVLPPLAGKELADEIREHHIYITASENEPSGNHHIEAAQCGLPILYIESGGIPEYCENFGLSFTEDFEKKFIGKEENLKSDYIDEADKIIGKILDSPQVTVDIGGGAAKEVAPKLLQKIGCQVIEINQELHNCSRGPDPTSDNLSDLVGATTKIGFAFDLDSDRVILVMNGEKKSSDLTLALGVVKAIKLGIKKFVLSLDSSLAIEKYIINNSGQVWRSKIGEANVIQAMLENNADAGGEGSSGGFILKNFNMCRDGILTSGLIASMINDENLQNDIEFFESFSQIRDKVSVESDLHEKILDGIKRELEEKYEISELDGIKIMIDKNTWSLIRKSNTEDIIRISSESNDKHLLDKTQKEMLKIVESCYEKIR